MDKRKFLTAAALGAASLPALASSPKQPSALRSVGLLTVTGEIARPNRAPMHAQLDPLFAKQGRPFTKAFEFDFDMLAALPVASVKPTLDLDGKVHVFSGPLLTDVLAAAGAVLKDATKLALRAIDGYASLLTMADVRKYRYLVATHMDGQPMRIGGMGPLFLAYDADRFPDKAALPVSDRFAGCPWGLYVIDVLAG